MTPDLDALSVVSPEIRATARLLWGYYPGIMSEDQYATAIVEWLLDGELMTDLVEIDPGSRVWYLYTFGLQLVRNELTEQQQHNERIYSVGPRPVRHGS